jgi:hypothetical protein
MRSAYSERAAHHFQPMSFLLNMLSDVQSALIIDTLLYLPRTLMSATTWKHTGPRISREAGKNRMM